MLRWNDRDTIALDSAYPELPIQLQRSRRRSEILQPLSRGAKDLLGGERVRIDLCHGKGLRVLV